MATALHPVDELASLSHRFGNVEARQKIELLRRIAELRKLSAKRIIRLHDTLYFMRAYPDSPAVLDAVRGAIGKLRHTVDAYTGGDTGHHAFVNSGVPGSSNQYAYSYAVLARLTKIFPGCLEIDWEGVTDESALGDALSLAITAIEETGLEDEYVSMQEWLQDCKSDPSRTDLEAVLEMFRRSMLDARQQEHVFETCSLPVTYDLRVPGTGRCEVSAPTSSTFYQKRPIARTRFPLRPKIRQPLTRVHILSRDAGQRMIDLALAALCSRNLEIYPLIYANAADVNVVECDRGIQVVLVSVRPEFRYALETSLFFTILKNGVPIAYGPATIFAGCCEMGINLFPEFRGGEIRYLYAQFMRALYHLANVRYFYLVSYGMGEGNPEALRSGAFWFYRKLGFRAADPDIEALARDEEAIMRRRPRYRSPLATLRELSYTSAYLDLSRATCRPLDLGLLGRAVTRHVARHFDGDRRRAERACASALIRELDIAAFGTWTKDEKAALQRVAPLLSLAPEIVSWPRSRKEKLARLLRSKGGRSELVFTGHVAALPEFVKLLERVADAARRHRM